MTTTRAQELGKLRRCTDAGLGSRNRRGNTCAGRVGPKGLCRFHASMRAFTDALREIEAQREDPSARPNR